MKLLHCPHCGHQVYYENTSCERCGTEFGFSPQHSVMVRLADEPGYRACLNRSPTPVCNWVVSPTSTSALCDSCQLTSTIPPLDSQQNLLRWVKVETAKRRLLYTLGGLGLMPNPKPHGDDLSGLTFRWLVPQPGTEVLTGHLNGVVTLNMEEADDGPREMQRERLNEYMRTLLGHLRHEIGHYLFETYVRNSAWMPAFRQLFGDENRDYAAALSRHYQEPDHHNHWQQHFVSAYAASHPLEDWAETTAHYLLIVDAMETARAWGLNLTSQGLDMSQAAGEQQALVPATEGAFLEEMAKHWFPAVRFLNAMSRSFGLRDSYAYLLTPGVLEKIKFVHNALQRPAHHHQSNSPGSAHHAGAIASGAGSTA